MGEMKKDVSLVVIRRLPRYYRYLTELKESGIVRISSKALAEKMQVTASQIRQDLNCFGGFGQQGYGYNVSQLQAAIGDILGLNENHTTIIIGAGNLGRAIANYGSFEKRGYRLIGIFDINPDVVGKVINGITVSHMDTIDEFFQKQKPDIAILTIPKNVAVEVAQKLASLGIRGIWNFSNMDLHMAVEGVEIENVHLSDSLMTLSYKIGKRKGENK